MTKSRGILPPRRLWSTEEVAELRAMYPMSTAAEISRALGRPVPGIYAVAKRLGLAKAAEFYASPAGGRVGVAQHNSAATRFVKGSVPPNKGKRRPGYAPGRSRETQFKKGHRGGLAAERYQPIGAERIRFDGVLERKVNDDLPMQRRWKAVHRIVWEESHGPIPEGHAVCFRPGMRTATRDEITVDRLELVSRGELGRRNVMWNRYPREVAEVIQLTGALKRKIKTRSEENALSAG